MSREDLPHVEIRSDRDYTTEYLESLPPVDFTLAEDIQRDEIKYVIFSEYEHCNKTLITHDTYDENDLNTSLSTKVFLHGWMSLGLESIWYKLLKSAYFSRGPHNIIWVDYTGPGSKPYEVSAANAKPVAKFIAEFLIKTQIPQENIHIIGHSLGSHVAGYIGGYIFEMSGKKVARITALDPAGPKYEHPDMAADMRLNSNQSEFLDVVHTDLEYAGFNSPLGHVDFYANDGKHQPGCPSREVDRNCSHARSTLYFTESVRTRNYMAQEAKTFGKPKRVTVEIVDGGKEVIFGDNVPTTARGVYHLKTNAKEPYLNCSCS